MRTLITGGTVVTASNVFTADVLVDDGRILEVGDNLGASLTTASKKAASKDLDVVDATGCYVMPGGVDVHTHVALTVGDTTVSDGFAAGTRAAAWGGTTTIVEHPGFGPTGCALAHQLEAYAALAQGQAAVDYAFHGVFQHVDEAVLHDIPLMIAQGVPSAKAYMTYDGRLDDEDLLRVLEAMGKAGGLLTVHAENHAITRYLADTLARTAPSDPRSHPASRPACCETEAVYRVVTLASVARAPLYVVHLSTAAGLAHIKAAQKAGEAVLAETCPQYLLLDERCYSEPNGLKYVCAPTPRTCADQDALWQGLDDGSIQVIATDHCSFSLQQKQQRGSNNVFHCPGGLPGIETRLPLMFSEGVLKARISLPRFVELCATAPARIMGLEHKGTLDPGADADILVLDPNDERVITARDLHQQTDFTPFEGRTVRGWPKHVWLRGQALIRDKMWCSPENVGCFVERHTYSHR